MKWKITLLLLCVLFAALVVKIWPEFYTVWMLNYRERVADQMSETNKVNLETGVVRVSLGRHKFNIPLRYMYWEAYKKRGYWPKVKPGRVEVGAISISVLLPEFKPYYEEDDDEWNVIGHGKRLDVEGNRRRNKAHAEGI